MPDSVEDRILRMEFDNAAFERKINATMVTLGKLEKSLQFEGAGKGLHDVAENAKRMNLENVGHGIDTLSAKFVALSAVAITVLSNIVNRAVDAGIGIAKALSLDPLTSGLSEYETNMTSIQTILSNTRADNTGLEDVNSALDQLNTYSDQTIYNFGQMARNIGTFTAAGVDLETSVTSIKGISNLAAISGSSADQAASAMYQLSQAVSTGTLRLMDWNSVVNAGMGGEVFQKALFTTGQALGELESTHMGQTFEEWTAAGNTFRGSLEDEWLTAEVLTTTLQGMAGEMTAAQAEAAGFTAEQAAQIEAMGRDALDAATKVRTFTNLVGTVKESIGSGWSASFRIVIGDFEQATELFTRINGIIGGIIGRSADARNAMLQGWSNLGGRTLVIESAIKMFENLMEVGRSIKEAFNDIFPPLNAHRLADMSWQLANLVNHLTPTQEGLEKIKRIARGFFAALDIGWEIIKNGAGFIKDLVVSLTGLGGGNFVNTAAGIGDFITAIHELLVEGGGIENFFNKLSDTVTGPIEKIKDGIGAVIDFFKDFGGEASDAAAGGADRVADRFGFLSGIFDGMGDFGEVLAEKFAGVTDKLDEAWDKIREWFSGIGERIGAALGSSNFDSGLDALNVGLFATIALAIRNFLKNPFSFDFGGGFFNQMSEMLGELTGVLQAMQTQIRAQALQRIAIAIAILAASLLVLSLIDSAALARALGAMTVAFGELIGTMALLQRMDLSSNAGSMALLAGAMVLMAGSIFILAAAARILATMDMEELQRGIGGATVLLGAMVAASNQMEDASRGMIRSAIAIGLMAFAMYALLIPIKIMASMDPYELGQGLIGVTVGLQAIARAMARVPRNMFTTGLGILAVAISLNFLALAVSQFSSMSIGELATGIGAAALGIAVLAIAIQNMPDNIGVSALGLLAMGGAFRLMAYAVKEFADMDWIDLGKGLLALVAIMGVMVIAANALEGVESGVAGVLVLTGVVYVLAEVLKGLADVSAGDLAKGVIAIVGFLGAMALVAVVLAPVIPAITALGIAIQALGLGFLLFGAAAYLFAEAFEAIAEAGANGSEDIVRALESVGRALPALMRGFAEGMVEVLDVLIEAQPKIVEFFIGLVSETVTQFGELIPQILGVLDTLIDRLIPFLQEKVPQLIEAGVFLLVSFLNGIRESVYEITTIVLDIILLFMTAVDDNIDQIIEAGVAILESFLQGIEDSIGLITESVFDIIEEFIFQIGEGYHRLVTAGGEALAKFIEGWSEAIGDVVDAVFDLITEFVEQVGLNFQLLVDAGGAALTEFLNGLTENVTEIGDAAEELIGSVSSEIVSYINSLTRSIGPIFEAASAFASKFIEAAVTAVIRLAGDLGEGLIRLLNATEAWIRKNDQRVIDAAMGIGSALIDGVIEGIERMGTHFILALVGLAQDALEATKEFFGVNSPAKTFIEIGESLIEGLVDGVDNSDPVMASMANLGNKTVRAFNKVLSGVADQLTITEEFNPTITPVLDMSKVVASAKSISGIMPTDTFAADLSYSTAQRIIKDSDTVITDTDEPDSVGVVGDVNFYQTINAPERLATRDIYKATRNQVAIAKEELKIP